jgi:hypothetical protein
MTLEQKSNAQYDKPIEPQAIYHLGHWLLAIAAVAVVSFGFMLLVTNGIINSNSSDGLGLILFPLTSALALAVANRKVLWRGAWLALPFLFALGLLLCFGGQLLMTQLEVKKTEETMAFLPILVENVPFFFGGLLMYQGYASMAGRRSFLAALLTVSFTVLTSLALYGEMITDENLLFTFFWSSLAMSLSIIHWQQPLRA